MQQLLKKKRYQKPSPLGSSDLQVKLKVVRMVDGFRPGRIVRVKGPWTYVLLPWDEHINNEEAYERSKNDSAMIRKRKAFSFCIHESSWILFIITILTIGFSSSKLSGFEGLDKTSQNF